MRHHALGLPELEHLAHGRPLLEDLQAEVTTLELRVRAKDCRAISTLAGARHTAGKIAGHLTGLKSDDARKYRHQLERANTRAYRASEKILGLCRRRK